MTIPCSNGCPDHASGPDAIPILTQRRGTRRSPLAALGRGNTAAAIGYIAHRMKTNAAREVPTRKLVEPFRVSTGRGFSLARVDPAETLWFDEDDKDHARDELKRFTKDLADLQDKLYAQDRWSLLLIFQALDAAGKDSAIKHVFSGINPQGCHVTSFKAPSQEELDHDYLWRCQRALPERGRIGIFNRSYYEEVLVVRVHEELLMAQKLPPSLVTPRIWEERYEDIRNLERYLARNGTVVRKFFLHVSRDEQRKRFLDRLDEPEKNWKFAAGDVRERAHWKEYMRAYEQMIRGTASVHAPWFVVPADHKWFTRLVVSAVIVDALSSLSLHYPRLSRSRRVELARARAALLGEDRKRPSRKR
jgi:PPK2 family polyphosphate:nucleotide phosphotransferase